MRSVAVLLVSAALIESVLAQAPIVPRDPAALKAAARIRGHVVAAATGRPLMLTTVTLAGGNPYIRRTTKTDSNGNYEFANLPAGRYSFSASRAGYLEQNFDQPSPFARYRLLELAEGEQLDGMHFRLHRGAVITGVITDEAGDPLPDALVQVMREQFGPSGRSLIAEMRTPVPIRTDDEGRYRVYALRPGMYVVTATIERSDDVALSFGRTYYPGTMDESEAQMVRVDFGQDAVANFSMIPARHARVSGVVRDSQGRAVTGAYITINEMRGSRFEPIGGHILKDDGSFEFEQMLSGSYVLQVRPATGRNPVVRADGERATVQLKVTGEDISDLLITTSSGFVVAGHVTFEGAAPASPIKGLRLFAREVDLALLQTAIPSSPGNGDVNSEGRFRIAGVSGRVRLFGGGAGWFVRRVLLRGADVTTSGFDVNRDVDGIEVVLTDRATIVTGTVRDAGGNSRNDFIVAFFPVGQFDRDQRASRQRTIRPDLDGIYRIRGLPAGDYLAAAVPAISLPIDGEWDPAFFARVRPMATGFKLAEGQTFALNLPLIE